MSMLVGLDLGGEKCMTVLGDGEVIRNELGGIGNASVVAFSGRGRHIGEAAVGQVSSNLANSITCVASLAGADHEKWSHAPASNHRAFKSVADERGSPAAAVTFRDEEVVISGTALLTALLAKMRRTLKDIKGEETLAWPAAVSVPPHATLKQRGTILDACIAAGYPSANIINSTEATAAVLSKKHGPEPGGKQRVVLIIDMGLTQTTISVVRLLEGGAWDILSEVSEEVGAAAFDWAIFEHFRAQLLSQGKEDIQPGTKRGYRLLNSCRTLRELLSTLPEARTTCENLCGDSDIPLTLSRDTLASVCESELMAFKARMHAAIAKAGEARIELSGVELMGGGTRSPLVQAIVSELRLPVGFKLDDAAVAYGATLVASNSDLKTKVETGMSEDIAPFRLSPEEVQTIAGAEKSMAAADAERALLGERRNAIEALILSMRSAPDGKNGNLIPRQELTTLLDTTEDWLWGEEAEQANLEEMTAREKSIQDEIATLCKDYYEAQGKDRMEIEKSLEDDAAKAALDKAAEGDDEDRDFRKLKYPDRMRMVTKNKEEGNELFQGGNWRLAGARYAKALGHAAKFFDLDPEQKAEIDALKVALYLNLSQCYLKLETWDQVIANTSHALDISPNNPKALYRRGYARAAKKEWDLAKEDLETAQKLAPDDRNITKILGTVKNAIAKQKQKEKSMWSRAFGTTGAGAGEASLTENILPMETTD